MFKYENIRAIKTIRAVKNTRIVKAIRTVKNTRTVKNIRTLNLIKERNNAYEKLDTKWNKWIAEDTQWYKAFWRESTKARDFSVYS